MLRGVILFCGFHILFTALWYLNLWDIRTVSAIRIQNSTKNATNTINTMHTMSRPTGFNCYCPMSKMKEFRTLDSNLVCNFISFFETLFTQHLYTNGIVQQATQFTVQCALHEYNLLQSFIRLASAENTQYIPEIQLDFPELFTYVNNLDAHAIRISFGKFLTQQRA